MGVVSVAGQADCEKGIGEALGIKDMLSLIRGALPWHHFASDVRFCRTNRPVF
jgi:hypothetical protein